ncbi:MAG: hypothetical protein JWO82_3331, partial [Akkermansiaceae bacterium]|nr:hypothetical protein [Akkermansiaceae bacterium]
MATLRRRRGSLPGGQDRSEETDIGLATDTPDRYTGRCSSCMKAALLFLTLLIGLNPKLARAEGDAPEYRTLKLNRGVEIDVPKAWTAANGPDKYELVATVTKELFDGPPSNGRILFEACDLSPDLGPARVMVRVEPAVVSTEQIKAMTPAILKKLTADTVAMQPKSDTTKIGPLNRIQIGECWGVEYLRQREIDGKKDIVRIIDVTTGANQIHVWLSYPAGNPDYRKPVMAHIKASL